MSVGGSFKEKVFWESDGMGGESNLSLTFCGQLISNLMKQRIWMERKWLNFGDRVLMTKSNLLGGSGVRLYQVFVSMIVLGHPSMT